MSLYGGWGRDDFYWDAAEGLGIDQYETTDPQLYEELTDALWNGWFASPEELDATFGAGGWDYRELRESFYEYGFMAEDIDWNQWREMMGYQ
jgi:hypothetical protein